MYLLKLLGTAVLVGPAGTVRGRAAHRRRLALLSVLAAARGRTVARERLVGLLWPEHPGSAARHLLAESLYILRKELGEQAILAVGDEVGLADRVVATDLAAFEDARTAGDWEACAAAYHGPFMDGFYVSEAPDFERWMEDERARLQAAFAEVLERLAACAEGAGAHLAAAEWWRRLGTLDPYSSRVALRRMQALEAGGERLQALRVASEHSAFLREELGAEPDVDLADFVARLRAAPPRRPPAPTSPVDVPAADEPELPAEADAPSPVPPPSDARVEEEAVDALPERPAEVEASARVEASTPVQARPRLALIAAVVGVFLVVALGILRREGGPGDDRAWATGLDPRRIAVLYLDGPARDRDLDPLAAEITEALISDLGRVDGLRVLSRYAVRQFRGRDVSLDTVARRLQVGTIVEGSVRRSGSRLRITVQLVDVATGATVHTRELEQPLADMFAVEDSVAAQVAERLRTALGMEVRLRESGAGTRSAPGRAALALARDAADEAARALVRPNPLGGRGLEMLLDRADSLAGEARRADPRWPEPLVLKGRIALMRAGASDADTARTVAALRAAQAFGDTALLLRPGAPSAREVRGTAAWQMSRQMEDTAAADSLMERADDDLTAALAADPTLAQGWATLSQLLRLGRGNAAGADAAARRALEADEYLVDAPVVMERLYRSAFALERFDSAQAWCDRGAERFPDDWRFVDCRLTLMGVEGGPRPDVRQAWRLNGEAGQLDPPEVARAAGRPYYPLWRRLTVARVLVRAGMRDSARAVLEAVRREVGGDPALTRSFLYDDAGLRYMLRDSEDVVLGLLRRYVNGSPRYREYLRHDVQFGPLRTDPRYQALFGGPPT